MNTIMAIVAFLVMTAFVVILLIHVPRLDLFAVIGFTVVLAAWDLISTIKSRQG